MKKIIRKILSFFFRKGVLLVIDGTDGSGKATQTKLLREALAKKRRVESTDFPRYDTNLLGRLIRESLDGLHGDFIAMDPKIVSVLYAVDRFETKQKIEDWLSRGFVVILDRYVSANQIHQGGKITDPKKREDFLGWLDKLEFGVLGLPRPDIIVYLHVPVEVSVKLALSRALKKGEAPDEAENNVRHQMEAQASALSIVKRTNNWMKIDCAPEGTLLPPEVIHGKVLEAVSKYV